MGRRGGGATYALMLALAGCAGGHHPPEPPPLPAPAVAEEVTVPSDDLGAAVLVEPGPAVHDEILSSPMLRHPELLVEVERWVGFWRTAGATWFSEYLQRMSWFSPAVDSALARRGLPASLRYLPIIESGYSPRAVSRVSAVGLWQFMAPTAKGLGMWVGPLLDERRNPYKSTEAAGDFLLSLRERFGSWFLALAAYNSGPYRVEQVLQRHAPLAPLSDSLYWEIRDELPRETRDFVPKFIGAAIVASNPSAHGIEVLPDSSGFAFDEVVVPDATTLDVVARAAESPQKEIERLNPEVLRGMTPPGRETRLRVPSGKGALFTENYARIPPRERVSFVEHRVARGETLSHIAQRYGVRVGDIQAANPRVNPRRLQIGQRITVPIAPRARGS